MKKITLSIFLFVFAFSICKGTQNDVTKESLTVAKANKPRNYKSPVDMGLQEIIDDNDMPKVVCERARDALANWRSTSEPILLRVVLYSNFLTSDDGRHRPTALEPIVLDKEDDLCGLRIREECLRDGTIVVIEEDYPVYVDHYTLPGMPLSYTIKSVNVRDKDQMKDIRAWEQYLVRILNWMYQKDRLGWEAVSQNCPEMPAVWISPPQSNKVRVYVSVYDSAGHASKYVEVENLMGRDEGWPFVNMNVLNRLKGIPIPGEN